jgi:hypothetical protein
MNRSYPGCPIGRGNVQSEKLNSISHADESSAVEVHNVDLLQASVTGEVSQRSFSGSRSTLLLNKTCAAVVEFVVESFCSVSVFRGTFLTSNNSLAAPPVGN